MSHYSHFKTKDLGKVFELINEYPFAVICKNNRKTGMPDIVNAPVIATADGQNLEFHMARANESWPGFGRGGRIRLIFNGPNAHISPSWYKDRFADGDRSRTAPTWNYVQASVTGTLQKMNPAELKNHLERLTGRFEGTASSGWAFHEINPKTLSRWQKLIAGFTVRVDNAEAICKLSQEQQKIDREHIIAGLTQRGGPDDLEVAHLIGDKLKYD